MPLPFLRLRERPPASSRDTSVEPSGSTATKPWPSRLPPLQRVNVVGVSGSGKSTFSARLAALLDSPHVQMDRVFWEPNWVEPPDARFFPRLEQAIAGERWVLDGNYHRTAPIKWPRTDTVVWLDYARARVLYQVVRRSVTRALRSQELWPHTGNRESFARLFSRQSVVLFSWRTHASHRARYEREMSLPSWPHLHFVRLESPREAASFLQAVRREAVPLTFARGASRG